MVSTTSILAIAAAVATTIDYVQAHGYIAKPAPSWKASKTNNWVVEIEPQWKGGWDESKGDEGLLATFKELAPKNNFKDVRSLMDGNPVFGEECGFTDPKGKPSEPPSDGTATFSRGIVHAGPCEIWLDDKMVLQNDDCQSAYGDGTQQTIAVFKPVDYSSCAAGGCMLRFYWLALQRLKGKTVWQAYKNCIPLTGPAGGGASQQDPATGGGSDTSQKNPDEDPSQQDPATGGGSDTSQKNPDEDPSQTSPSTGDSSKKEDSDKEEGSDKKEDSDKMEGGSKSDTPSGGEQQTPEAPSNPAPETPSNSAPETPPADTPEMAPAPAPSSKCNGRRRRRY